MAGQGLTIVHGEGMTRVQVTCIHQSGTVYVGAGGEKLGMLPEVHAGPRTRRFPWGTCES